MIKTKAYRYICIALTTSKEYLERFILVQQNVQLVFNNKISEFYRVSLDSVNFIYTAIPFSEINKFRIDISIPNTYCF